MDILIASVALFTGVFLGAGAMAVFAAGRLDDLVTALNERQAMLDDFPLRDRKTGRFTKNPNA